MNMIMQKFHEVDYSHIPDSPALTVEIRDKPSGLEGWVCIHSMGRYGASGGMRCLPDVTKTEVQLLARAMTYKYSFWDIEQGGAKAGLVVPYECPLDERYTLFQRAASHLKPLINSGIWSPWTDMNFHGRDLEIFYAGMGKSFKASEGGSSERTALTAFHALKAVAAHLGLAPSETRIVIEGFGSVARYLTEMLRSYGARIVAVSTHRGCIANNRGLDPDYLIKQAESGRSDWVVEKGPWENLACEEIFSIPCDILMPGARVHSIDEQVALKLDAKALVPMANVPCTDAALAVLDTRRILYVPDFVVNGGGVCGHILGRRDEKLRNTYVESFEAMIRRMLERSKVDSLHARSLAEAMAHSNYGAIAKGAYFSEKGVVRMVHALQRRKLLPGNSAKKIEWARVGRTLTLLNSAFR